MVLLSVSGITAINAGVIMTICLAQAVRLCLSHHLGGGAGGCTTLHGIRNGDAGISSVDVAHVYLWSIGYAVLKLLLHAMFLLGDVRRLYLDLEVRLLRSDFLWPRVCYAPQSTQRQHCQTRVALQNSWTIQWTVTEVCLRFS